MAELLPSPPPRVSLIRALLIGATVLGLLTSAQHWTVMQLGDVDTSWRTIRHALSSQMPVWYLWVLLAPAVRFAVQGAPLARGRLHVAIPIHVAVAVTAVLLHDLMLLATHRILAFPTPEGPLLAVFVARVPYRITIGLLGYAVLFGAVLAADYYGRLRERQVSEEALRRQLAEARLETLRMQLNPHFLFNAMNSVAMLVRRGDRSEAVDMLAGLSDLLRQSLTEAPPQETALGQELAFAERYLDIERARFADRLRVEIDVAPELLDATVPTFVLQPLVENAIRHGIARKASAGLVRIAARSTGGRLELEVSDDGPGFGARPAPNSSGIGLDNTRRRLTQLYGAGASLSHAARAGGGTLATVVLPLRRHPSTTGVDAVAPA